MTSLSMSNRTLTGAQKAAIIVRLISKEGGVMPLSSLSPNTQHRLANQFQKLGKVDNDTVQAVIEDFSNLLSDPSLSFPSDLGAALKMIESNLSPDVANDLRRRAGLEMQNDPWIEITKIPVPALAATLLQEGTHVGAIVLSKLSPEAASEVIAALPEDTAKAMTYAVEETKTVAPNVVAQIGAALSYLAAPSGPQAFPTTPVTRVADILNAALGAQRDAMLDALDVIDATFAAEVREAIFTFADIAIRIEGTDVPRIIREVDPEVMVRALAAAQVELGDSVTFILTNMSQRMADQLRDEMTEAGSIALKIGEQAMGQVCATIRKLKEDGEIKFIKQGGDEDAEAE